MKFLCKEILEITEDFLKSSIELNCDAISFELLASEIRPRVWEMFRFPSVDTIAKYTNILDLK